MSKNKQLQKDQTQKSGLEIIKEELNLVYPSSNLSPEQIRLWDDFNFMVAWTYWQGILLREDVNKLQKKFYNTPDDKKQKFINNFKFQAEKKAGIAKSLELLWAEEDLMAKMDPIISEWPLDKQVEALYFVKHGVEIPPAEKAEIMKELEREGAVLRYQEETDGETMSEEEVNQRIYQALDSRRTLDLRNYNQSLNSEQIAKIIDEGKLNGNDNNNNPGYPSGGQNGPVRNGRPPRRGV
jgi:hypothetical protein